MAGPPVVSITELLDSWKDEHENPEQLRLQEEEAKIKAQKEIQERLEQEAMARQQAEERAAAWEAAKAKADAEMKERATRMLKEAREERERFDAKVASEAADIAAPEGAAVGKPSAPPLLEALDGWFQENREREEQEAKTHAEVDAKISEEKTAQRKAEEDAKEQEQARRYQEMRQAQRAEAEEKTRKLFEELKAAADLEAEKKAAEAANRVDCQEYSICEELDNWKEMNAGHGALGLPAPAAGRT